MTSLNLTLTTPTQRLQSEECGKLNVNLVQECVCVSETCHRQMNQKLFEAWGRYGGSRSVLESRPGEEDGEDDEVYEPAGHSCSSHTHIRYSVHLLLVNQFGGVHKVLAVKQDDGGCDGTGSPPEHHVSQSLRPCVTWRITHGQ